MKHLHVTILSQRHVAEGYYEMTFSWPADAPTPQPGQFFTVKVGAGPSPLLRRPFAFSGITARPQDGSPPPPGSARCIYQKRGPATLAMSGMVPGDELDILAPLGTAFPPPTGFSGLAGDTLGQAGSPGSTPDSGSDESTPLRPLLLAGGVGVGPMLFLAESWRTHNPLLVIGARSADFLPQNALPQGIETVLCTDDGSSGHRGTVIDAVDAYRAAPRTAGLGGVYACGPNPMLAAAHRWAAQHAIPCYVSMEQTMGCAVGACMGCVVPILGPQPYARVCIEGPVFASEIIDWEGLAHG